MKRKYLDSITRWLIAHYSKKVELLLAICIFVFPAFSQDTKETIAQPARVDTQVLNNPELIFIHTELIVPPYNGMNNSNFPAFIRQSFATPIPSLQWKFDEENDLNNIWKQEVAAQEELLAITDNIFVNRNGRGCVYCIRLFEQVEFK